MGKKYKCALTEQFLIKNELYKFSYHKEYGLLFDLNFVLTGDKEIFICKSAEIKEWFNQYFFNKNLGINFDNLKLSQIKSQILKEYSNKILTLIALAKKSGKLILGKTKVKNEIKNKEKDGIIIQALDASYREKFKNNEKYFILEEFNSNIISSYIGTENTHYGFLYGDFFEQVFKFTREKKLFEEIDEINDR